MRDNFPKNSPLVYAKKISSHLKKNIWLKLEILNPTGSHKDRESIKLIKEAKKRRFKAIGCASTGNLAISLAFFSKIYNIKSKIWLRKQDININSLNLIKSLGGEVFIRKTKNLSELYELSSVLMEKNKVFNANPNSSDLKYLANAEILKEVYKINKNINSFISCVNNGSHIIGLKSALKNSHKLYAVYSKSKLATSINAFSKYEQKNLINKFDIEKEFFEAKYKDILYGYKLLALEGLTCEPSSAAVVGMLRKIKDNNVCCIISGSIHKNLILLQNILK